MTQAPDHGVTDAPGEPLRRGKHRRRTVLLVLAGALLVLIGSVAWVGVRGLMVKSELEALMPTVGEVQLAAESGDVERMHAAMLDVRDGASSAAALTADPVWRIAESIPTIGPNLTAVRLTARTLDEVAQPGVELLETVDDVGASESGQIDVQLLRAAEAPLADLASALAAADEELPRVDSATLIPQLTGGYEQLRALVAEITPLAIAASDAAAVVPGLLGVDGQRNILMMLQNNAEVRTGGGIAGTFVLLEAEDGAVEMVDMADSSRFQPTSDPILDVPSSTLDLYGNRVGTYVQNATTTADFTMTADLVTSWWSTISDVEPDAVISIDPELIAALLAVTGPVALEDGTEITTDNAVERLLVEPYFRFDVEEQTTYQQESTARLMTHILGASIDVVTWLQVLSAPLEQGRISVWSADSDEQKVLSRTQAAGPLGRHEQAGDDAFAVYFNDATAGKMDPFLKVALSTGAASCRPDGLMETAIGVTLTNDAPLDAGTVFPWWVNGGGLEGVEPGTIATNVTVAAPSGSFPGGVTLNGRPVVSSDVDDLGFMSSLAQAAVAPGESATLEFRFLHEGDETDARPTLLHTPMIHSPEVSDTPIAMACD